MTHPSRTFAALALSAFCALLAPTARAADPAPPSGTSKLAGGKDGAPPEGKTLTRDQLRQCMALEADIKTQNTDMRKAQDALQTEKAEIARMQEELKEAQPKVDPADADAVKAFNDKLTDNEKRVEDYNAKVPAFNAQGEKLQAVQTTWQTDCAGRPYNEADFYAIKRGK